MFKAASTRFQYANKVHHLRLKPEIPTDVSEDEMRFLEAEVRKAKPTIPDLSVADLVSLWTEETGKATEASRSRCSRYLQGFKAWGDEATKSLNGTRIDRYDMIDASKRVSKSLAREIEKANTTCTRVATDAATQAEEAHGMEAESVAETVVDQ